LQKSLGRTIDCVLIKERSEVIGYFVIVTFPLFKGKTICYLPYGPVFVKKISDAALQDTQAFLKKYGIEKKAVCVRTELTQKYKGFQKTPLFAYRTSFHQARGEASLDLNNQTLESLHSQFSKSTKRNIKKAEKNNLDCVIYSGEKMLSQLETYIQLNEQNTADHQTTTHTHTYFSDLFSLLSTNPNNFVVTVSENNNPLAISVYTVFNKKTYCPFGASTKEGKRLGAYYTNKLSAIEHMISLGVMEFNWGGISVGKNDDNLDGLNSFKLGWGTKSVEHNDFYDLIISSWYWIYLGYNLIKKLR